jgi:hypothetical protein
LSFGHLNILNKRANCNSRFLRWGSCIILLLLSFLIDVAEDIIEYKVSGGLFGQDEGLDEFLELGRFVGGFTDDLNDDAIVGALRIDIGDADLALLEIEFLDTFLDSL